LALTTFTCNAPGTHTLTFTVTDGKACTDSQSINVTCINPGLCGNGILEAGEFCDDGNLVNGDGCSSTCQDEINCGDGVVEGSEQCDPPNPGFCSPTCQNVPPLCGDGLVQAGEDCEPPNTATCDANCQTFVPPTCGDGVVNQPSEECEPPNTATCDANCQTIGPVPCGNGVIDPGEQCDPPNTSTCNATCQLGGSCTDCENANCGTVVSDCTTGPNADLCIAALQCSRVNDCYNLDPAICYCGAVDIVACQGATGPAGPCITQYNAAASSPTPSQVLLDLTDPSTALGRAGFIQQCDNAFCPGCP
jgi:cysteine-rich repeat protein